MSKKLFGTDGIRGTANIEPITAETALRLGRAAAYVFSTGGSGNPNPPRGRHTIVLGRDTRLSGYMLESAIVAGITSLGVDVLLVGPLPTPGVAYITRSLRADAGMILSASHNPYEDNGIKFFRYDGYKLSHSVEASIERLVLLGSRRSIIHPTAAKIGRVVHIDDALIRYVEHAKRSFPHSYTLGNLRIALDCANGAAYKSSPNILRELGADLCVLHDAPNGININKDSGSTFPQAIQKFVLKTRAHVGITHDGDADRVLFCDEKGDLLDGDEIMAIVALDSLRKHLLVKDTLVATVMSNVGLDEAITRCGGRVIRTNVGDRHLIEEMLRNGLNIGGEQSGHLIFRDYTTTGDGIVSALQILRIMIESRKPLSELKRCLVKYPQVQRDLMVRKKPPISSLSHVQNLIEHARKVLKGRGRVLLRYSGTEPKIRLLIEGQDERQIAKMAKRITDALFTAIGTQDGQSQIPCSPT
jgi:phosphoglucosamine mutase